jgi:hypothetical protein
MFHTATAAATHTRTTCCAVHTTADSHRNHFRSFIVFLLLFRKNVHEMSDQVAADKHKGDQDNGDDVTNHNHNHGANSSPTRLHDGGDNSSSGPASVTQKRNREESAGGADDDDHDEVINVGSKKSKSDEDLNTSSVPYGSVANGANGAYSSQATFGGLPFKSTLSPAGDSEIIEVMQDKVGQIIGSKGAIIQELQILDGGTR